MEKTTHIIAVCLLATGLGGCSGSNDFTPTQNMAPGELFAQACSSCHGENGGGKFGFLLSIAGTELPAEDIVTKIQNGGHIMPAFPNIGATEAQAVAEYIKAQ